MADAKLCGKPGAQRLVFDFILDNLRRRAPGVVFVRAQHVGVVALPLVADQLLQLFEGETGDPGKRAVAAAGEYRKLTGQRAGQR